MTEPGQSAEEMIHLTIDCAKASSGHPSAENDATQPLPQWINCTFKEADDLMVRVASRELRHLSKGAIMELLGVSHDDVLTMSHIATRLQMIASNILDARETPKLKMVQNNG